MIASFISLSNRSTALFAFAYSFYFFFYESDMTGFLQISFFFGYNLLVCWAFFMALGSVSFYASLVFVRKIYKNAKPD